MARKLPIGARIGKVWGWTKPLLQTETTEVQHLFVKAGFQCSDHEHGHKVNRFYVVAGRLRVVTAKDGLADEVVLGPGEMTDIRPGDGHRFEALTDCELIELYWVTLDPDDITRHTQGGPVEPPRSAPDGSGTEVVGPPAGGLDGSER